MSNIVNFHYDELNSFGTLPAANYSTTAGTFPNILNMGDASAERMTVDLKLPDGPITASTAITIEVHGANTETGTYVAIVKSGDIAAANLNKDGYGLPIPKTKFKFLKVIIRGTISAGKIQAIINTTVGP